MEVSYVRGGSSSESMQHRYFPNFSDCKVQKLRKKLGERKKFREAIGVWSLWEQNELLP
ncbi:unnamed protein product, partial [Nesidiocoris tenuis]